VRRALILYNPTAGRGTGEATALLTGKVLESSGWEAKLAPTQGPGDATRIGGEADADRLVVVGGDGTLREAAEGVLAAGRTLELGFVPRGNANVVARELSIPLAVDGAVRTLIQGRPRAMDIMRANGRFVLAMVGLGYDARVVHSIHAARSRPRLRHWYRLHADSLYGVLGVGALFGRYPASFRVLVDGEDLGGGFRHGVVCNVETYAKGWAMTPGATVGDGRLDWALRRSSGPLPAALAMAAAAARRMGPRWLARRGTAERLVLEAEGAPIEWQADGDPQAPVPRLELQVEPGALRVVAP
jgi:diacylglycerol kinase (ATP)